MCLSMCLVPALDPRSTCPRLSHSTLARRSREVTLSFILRRGWQARLASRFCRVVFGARSEPQIGNELFRSAPQSWPRRLINGGSLSLLAGTSFK